MRYANSLATKIRCSSLPGHISTANHGNLHLIKSQYILTISWQMKIRTKFLSVFLAETEDATMAFFLNPHNFLLEQFEVKTIYLRSHRRWVAPLPGKCSLLITSRIQNVPKKRRYIRPKNAPICFPHASPERIFSQPKPYIFSTYCNY